MRISKLWPGFAACVFAARSRWVRWWWIHQLHPADDSTDDGAHGIARRSISFIHCQSSTDACGVIDHDRVRCGNASGDDHGEPAEL